MKKTKLWAFIMALCLVCTGITSVYADTSLSDIQARQKEIQTRLNEAKAQLSTVNSQINAEKKKQQNILQ